MQPASALAKPDKGNAGGQCALSHEKRAKTQSADALSEAIATKVAAGMASSDIDKYLKDELCFSQLTKGQKLATASKSLAQEAGVAATTESWPWDSSDEGDVALDIAIYYSPFLNHYYAVASYEWVNNDYEMDEEPDSCIAGWPTSVGGRDGFGIRVGSDESFDNTSHSLRLWGNPAYDGQSTDFEGGYVSPVQAYPDTRAVFYTWQDNVAYPQTPIIDPLGICHDDGIDYDSYGGLLVFQMDIMWNPTSTNECRYAQAFAEYRHTYTSLFEGDITGASVGPWTFGLDFENTAQTWPVNASTYPSSLFCPNRTQFGTRPSDFVEPGDCNCSGQGGGTSPPTPPNPPAPPPPPPVAVRSMVDIDGDGKADLVGRYSDHLWVRLSTSSGSTISHNGSWIDMGGGWNAWDHIQFGDINGDGKPELVGRYDDHLYYLVNTSTNGSVSFNGDWINGGPGWNAWDTLLIKDIDGDGKADLVGRYSDHLWAKLSTSSGSTISHNGSWIDMGGGWNAWDNIQFSDINGDGKPELVGRTADHLYYRNNTSTTGTVSFNGGWVDGGSGWNAWDNIMFKDLDGDGKADLIGRYADHLYYRISTSAPGTVSFNGGWLDQGGGWNAWDSIVFGDINGDGKAEFAGRYADHLYYRVNTSSTGTISFNGGWVDGGGGWNAWNLYGAM